MPEFHNLTTAVKTIRVLKAVTAGSSDSTAALGVDTLGYEGVRAIAVFGTITDTFVGGVKLQYSSDNNVNSAWTDIAGSHATMQTTGDSNNMAITDVFKPQQRYVHPVVSRATANGAIDAVIVELYRGEQQAISKDATVSVQTILSNPAGGTA